MGVDACVSLRITYNADAVVEAANDLLYFSEVAVETIDADSAAYHPIGATHCLSGWCSRYYDAGYERGCWPKIHGMLAAVLATPGVDTVWYYGDDAGTDGNMDEYILTLDRLLQITSHYVFANRSQGFHNLPE